MHPFSSGALVPDVDAQFSTTHSFYHPVKGAASNPFCTGVGAGSTMESPWNQNNDHNLISCFDCHGPNGHGYANQRMLLDPIDFATMEATTDKSDATKVPSMLMEIPEASLSTTVPIRASTVPPVGMN